MLPFKLKHALKPVWRPGGPLWELTLTALSDPLAELRLGCGPPGRRGDGREKEGRTRKGGRDGIKERKG